jgi:hypothetical protein
MLVIKYMVHKTRTILQCTNKKRVLVSLVIVTTIAISMVFTPSLVVAQPLPSYLTIQFASIQRTPSGLNAGLQTAVTIPQDGSGGAFGYGLITNVGLSAVIVATTHKHILDSTSQNNNPLNPVWHTHYVSLAVSRGGPCGSNPQVVAISKEQPGFVGVSGNNVRLANMPLSFTGTNALNGAKITLTPGNNVQQVVSFTLTPLSGTVCVTNIQAAQNVRVG